MAEVDGIGRGPVVAEAGGAGRGSVVAAAPRFEVRPFVNTKRARAFSQLELGLPALIAERLGDRAATSLRFVGGPELFGRAGSGVPRSQGPGSPRAQPPGVPRADDSATSAADWIIKGAFGRDPTQRMAVTVELWRADGVTLVAEATRAGDRGQVDVLALQAAHAALAEVGLMPAALGFEVDVLRPFGRDPYAFTLYGRGVGLWLRAGRPAVRAARALPVLRRAANIDPDIAEIHRFRAVVELGRDKPVLARAALTRAVDLRPDYLPALRALALLDRDAGRPGVRDRLARVLALDPDDHDVRLAHAELLQRAGELEPAERELRRVLAARPMDREAQSLLVLVLASRRAGKELVQALEEVVRQSPENLQARLDLAAAYLSVADHDRAAGTYAEILRRQPRHPAALKLSGDLARKRGDRRQAAVHYGKLRWAAPLDPRPLFLMASLHVESGNLDMAERLLREAAHFPRMRAEALSNLGAIALRRNQPLQSLWFLERAVKGLPGRASVRYNHAVALYRLSRHIEALDQVRAALVADPDDGEAHFLAGVVELRLGLLDEAAKSFGRVLATVPGHEQARGNLALLESLTSRDEGSLSFMGGETKLLIR